MSEVKHTPGPWVFSSNDQFGDKRFYVAQAEGAPYTPNYSDVATLIAETVSLERVAIQEANARLIAAAPDLLAACENTRDMLATDRQAFVDGQRLRDIRTEDPIAHGLVAVEDGVWLASEDAEALRDYDRALSLIDAAVAKATGEKQS